MTDWPQLELADVPPGMISAFSTCAMSGHMQLQGAASSPSTWPAANRAIYWPFYLQQTFVATQMSVQIGTNSGNSDVGIYDEAGNRLVSTGSTALAAGANVFNITDTTLLPGGYFAAMCVDNTTQTVERLSAPDTSSMRALGVQEQAVGAVTLPNPATFSTPPTSAYIPVVCIYSQSVAV